MNVGTLLTTVGLLWMASEIGLLIFRRHADRADNRDRRSLLWLNLTVYTSLATGIAVPMFGVGRTGLEPLACAWAGLALIVLGISIRWIAILTLRRFFTVNVAIQGDQTLITSGIYRRWRHPAYAGALLSFAGIGLALDNWISLLVLLIPIGMAFAQRIRVEEQAMLEAFGDAYAAYARTSWRVLPGII
ncbi:MAG: isoprenylcysteine carboxylmethyltransferase family protein [Bacteroidetes bacterium]|jgi:protein-S-isoprenylcysteine O-methyltransferase|nr:isoprenylcysteine carboxylmethyltransferase family protein [Bacteroidota bacterium]